MYMEIWRIKYFIEMLYAIPIPTIQASAKLKSRESFTHVEIGNFSKWVNLHNLSN